ncbi:MAG: Maf family protein [Candidatus Electronema sp. VV]
MFTSLKPVILASASPRRQQFLRDLGLDFICQPADIDETPLSGEQPAAFARRMAAEKAEAVAASRPASWVIGADTVVTLDGQIIGKPADEGHALEILRALRGRTHQVITGLALVCQQDGCAETLAETSEVTFANFPDAMLAAYIRTGEPMDKAGAYGIQARGAFLVESLRGSCSNVIGLPLSACIALLLRRGVIAPLS